MKNKLFLAAFAAAGFALVGCNEKNVELPAEDLEPVELSISVVDPMTKFVSGPDGTEINDVQMYVFDEDGVLEAYAHDEGTSSSVTCTPGTKTVVALVNAEEHADVSSFTDLCTRTTDLFKNTSSGCVMEGKKTVEVTKAASVSIEVTRGVARFVLNNVFLDIELDHYKDAKFEVQAIYLINLVGDRPFFSHYTPTYWYNKMTLDEENKAYDIIYTECSDVLSNGEKLETEHVFYAFPNPATIDSQEETWSQRPTRLVVEGTFDGVHYYYPLTMESFNANCSYNASITIRRPGSSSPDIPVDKYVATAAITVKNWLTGGSYSDII